MVAETRTNVQRSHTPVQCRRCGQLLTAPQSVLDGIGPECIEIERSGTVPAGREWKLQVGDWVTWEREGLRRSIGEIVGYDPYAAGRFEIERYDRFGSMVDRVSVSKYRLTFAGTSMPDELAQGRGAA